MKVGKHGKAMSSYEEAIMDLMIKIEESERYLKRYKKVEGAVIVMGNNEEESYPSFSIRGKGNDKQTVQKEVQSHVEEHSLEMLSYSSSYEPVSVKLTLWEWLAARKKGISTLLLLFTAIFLHVYITWTAMNDLSVLILNGMKYGCVLLLALKVFRCIKNGDVHNYLNEEC